MNSKRMLTRLAGFCLVLLAGWSIAARAQNEGPLPPPPKFEVKRIPSVPHPGPPPIPVETIIQKFAANEDAEQKIYNNFDFIQEVRIEEVSNPGGSLSVTGEMYTKPDGKRFWRVLIGLLGAIVPSRYVTPEYVSRLVHRASFRGGVPFKPRFANMGKNTEAELQKQIPHPRSRKARDRVRDDSRIDFVSDRADAANGDRAPWERQNAESLIGQQAASLGMTTFGRGARVKEKADPSPRSAETAARLGMTTKGRPRTLREPLGLRHAGDPKGKSEFLPDGGQASSAGWRPLSRRQHEGATPHSPRRRRGLFVPHG